MSKEHEERSTSSSVPTWLLIAAAGAAVVGCLACGVAAPALFWLMGRSEARPATHEVPEPPPFIRPPG